MPKKLKLGIVVCYFLMALKLKALEFKYLKKKINLNVGLTYILTIHTAYNTAYIITISLIKMANLSPFILHIMAFSTKTFLHLVKRANII